MIQGWSLKEIKLLIAEKNVEETSAILEQFQPADIAELLRENRL
ncbi:MAG: hypothetical protein WAP58_04755 [Peptococcia bacterium]